MQHSITIHSRLYTCSFSKKGFFIPDVNDDPNVAQSSDDNNDKDEVEEIEKEQGGASTSMRTIALRDALSQQMLCLLY